MSERQFVRNVIGLAVLLLQMGCLSTRPTRPDETKATTRVDVVLPNAHSFVLPRTGGAGSYRIFVALPQSYHESSTRYPVLYTLDANAGFALITQTHRILRVDSTTPDVIIVGIGYDGPGPERRARRGKDLTPTHRPSDSNTGGSKEFLAFLAEIVVPFVDSNYRTIPQNRVIHGHSLGGLFALYALFHQPDLFRRYIVSSPSLWWDDAVMLKVEAEFAQLHTSLPTTVFLSVGANEPEDMLEHFAPFVDALRSRNYAGLTLDAVVLPDEDHLSIMGPAFVRGLRAVFRSTNPETATATPVSR
ncbi:MAG TPA: alpha/beta hydrolase-fold protein [Rhodothermia bacterium]|nr:alpha/beta hydrolase-fold protein [Rhodothermia bacterium]